MPVVGVRTVTDRQTSGAPLVDQSGDAVQTDHTFHVGAIDAGASERIGQVLSREVTTAEVLSRIVNWHACRIARCPSTGGRVASWLGVPPTPVPTGGCVPAFSGGCRHGGVPRIMTYPGGHPRAYLDVCVWPVRAYPVLRMVQGAAQPLPVPANGNLA